MAIEAQLVKSFPVRLVIIGLFTLGLGALLIYWISRSYVKTLDDDGVMRRDGRRFAWRDLKKVQPIYWRRYGNTWLNNVDLKFADGKAGVFFRMYTNGTEVLDFVRKKTGQPIPLSM